MNNIGILIAFFGVLLAMKILASWLYEQECHRIPVNERDVKGKDDYRNQVTEDNMEWFQRQSK